MKSRPYAFSKDERLKRRRDFDLVFGEGKAVSGRWLVVHGRSNDLGHNRLGLAVGKKHGGAVARNRLKRLLREAYRTQKPELPQGYDLVVVPRRGCPDDLQSLRDSLAQLLPRIADTLATVPKSLKEDSEQ